MGVRAAHATRAAAARPSFENTVSATFKAARPDAGIGIVAECLASPFVTIRDEGLVVQAEGMRGATVPKMLQFTTKVASRRGG